MKTYGMFSDKGNELVQHVVDIAVNSEWSFEETVEFILMIAKNDSAKLYEEITDTVVLESVYAELNRERVERAYLASDDYQIDMHRIH